MYLVLISTKFNVWTCHVCGSKDIEPSLHKTEHNIKNTKQKEIFIKNESLFEKLRNSPQIPIGILVVLILAVGLFFLNSGDSKEEEKKKKKNVVNATVNVQDQTPDKNKLKLNKVESDLCYLYDIKNNANSVSGLVNCKEGELTVNFYDTISKSVVDTKTVAFKDYKFHIKFDNTERLDLKFEIQLTKEQIKNKQKEIKKGKDISSIKPYSNDENNEEEENKGCQITDWTFSKYSEEYLVVNGKTSCLNGRILLRIYDEDNNNLGRESDSIEFGVFSLFFKTNANPHSISLKYEISEK